MTVRSPLHDEHVRLGAKMTEFGGWEMPLQYRSVVAEHRAVRGAAGVFDVSHLGKLMVSGVGHVEFLDSILPGRVSELAVGRAAYNLVLNERAGIVDDIFVYRLQDRFLVVPNASNTSDVLGILRGMAPPGVEVKDDRETWAILALSGPGAKEIGSQISPESSDLKLHAFTQSEIHRERGLVARTGYTGEFTFEFFVPWTLAKPFWSEMLAAGERRGLIPTGLGARDTLRLEMGYPLHGHEITEDTNPVEAGLSWVIRWEKPSFLGRDALLRVRDEKPLRVLVGLVARGREIPRGGYSILHNGDKVGELTSGNFSPTLRRGIAMGYVAAEFAQVGTSLVVDVRGRELQMDVTKPPFIES